MSECKRLEEQLKAILKSMSPPHQHVGAEHPQRTPSCLSIPRLRLGHFSAPDEQAHVENCIYCRKIVQAVQTYALDLGKSGGLIGVVPAYKSAGSQRRPHVQRSLLRPTG